MSMYKRKYKITKIEDLEVPGIPNCKKLCFGDDNSEANVLGYWILENQPKVGGYFAPMKAGGAAYLEKDL